MKIPFGSHIIQFNGGLGNQMFEYAFYLAIQRRMPFHIYGFDIYGSEDQHYGFELDRIFHISTARQRKICQKLRKLERHSYIAFSKVVENNCWTFGEEYLQKRLKPTEYIGFWQTEKYFQRIENIIRRVFSFREELLNEKTVEMANLLAIIQNTISLHIRRGDYVENSNCQTYGIQYYKEAVELINKCMGGVEL